MKGFGVSVLITTIGSIVLGGIATAIEADPSVRWAMATFVGIAAGYTWRAVEEKS